MKGLKIVEKSRNSKASSFCFKNGSDSRQVDWVDPSNGRADHYRPAPPACFLRTPYHALKRAHTGVQFNSMRDEIHENSIKSEDKSKEGCLTNSIARHFNCT